MQWDKRRYQQGPRSDFDAICINSHVKAFIRPKQCPVAFANCRRLQAIDLLNAVRLPISFDYCFES
jgi:hypothetical protein